jgi:5,10-methylenetetrahydromethanopterin reductase
MAHITAYRMGRTPSRFRRTLEFADLRQRAGSREEFAGQLPDAWIDQLAVVGDPRTAAVRVAALEESGVTDLVLIPAGDDPRTRLAELARILPEVRRS